MEKRLISALALAAMMLPAGASADLRDFREIAETGWMNQFPTSVRSRVAPESLPDEGADRGNPRKEREVIRLITEGDLTYAVLSDTDMEVEVHSVRYNSSSYDIPATIGYGESGTYTVVGVGPSAFKSNNVVKEVTLPETVRYIGDEAFSRCLFLTTVNIPSSVTSFGYYCFAYSSSLASITIPASMSDYSAEQKPFYNCSALQEIKVEEGNQWYTSEDGVLYDIDKNVLVQCPTGKKSCTFPFTLTAIGEYAFFGNSGLSDVKLYSPLKSIGGWAFSSSNITSVSVPSSVEVIQPAAFSNCQMLGSIEVDGGNANYSSANGILYSKDRKVLWQCPAGKKLYDIPSDVNEIGAYAFYGCTNISSISIPWSVSVIGPFAFAMCTNVASLRIPEPVTEVGTSAFLGCMSLLYANIEGPLTELADGLFAGCGAMKTLNLPSTLTRIGEYAVMGCEALESVEIPASVTEIGPSAFLYCTNLKTVTLPDQLLSLGEYAFSSCSALESVSIPNGVTAIPDFCFALCTKLSKVKFPTGLKSIGKKGFSQCPSLTSLLLPESLASIGDFAFEGCVGMRSFSLPESVADFGWGVLAGCNLMEYISVARSNDCFKSVDGVLFNYDGDVLVAFPAAKVEYEIPEDVKEIAPYAFYECRKLEKLSIPTSVLKIGKYAMSECSRLRMANIPPSITELEEYTFYHCEMMENIIIPSSMDFIGHDCFGRSEALGEFYCYPETPPELGETAIYGYASYITLHVPVGRLDEYKRAWIAYKDVVEMNRFYVTISDLEMSVGVGESQRLTYQITDKNNVGVNEKGWCSSNPEVATVTPFGEVKGLKDGKATISCWATYGTGHRVSASCRVVVGTGVDSVEGIEDTDAAADAPARYYTIGGVPVSADAMTPGLYIMRRGAKAEKILVQ